jgi:hypothetical protein
MRPDRLVMPIADAGVWEMLGDRRSQPRGNRLGDRIVIEMRVIPKPRPCW